MIYCVNDDIAVASEARFTIARCTYPVEVVVLLDVRYVIPIRHPEHGIVDGGPGPPQKTWLSNYESPRHCSSFAPEFISLSLPILGYAAR
jgi:hypothetical protein